MQGHQDSTWCWPVCAACTTLICSSWFVHRDNEIKITDENGSEGVNMTEDGFLELFFFVQKKWPAREEQRFGLNWVFVLVLFTNE